MPRLRFVLPAALAAALAFAAGPALAEGVSVETSAAGVTVLIDYEQATMHFDYYEQCGQTGQPCYEIDAGAGLANVPVSGGGPCKVVDLHLECAAAGIGAFNFEFKQSGVWAGYNGGPGEHAAGPCSPATVRIETGVATHGVVEVSAWNGCAETVTCDSPKATMTQVQVDASDAVLGKCSFVDKH
jgi:hypothetical protein